MNGSTSTRRPHKKASATSCRGAHSTSMARPRTRLANARTDSHISEHPCGFHRIIVHCHHTAARGQVQPAGIRVDVDVPGLKAGLAKIHLGLYCRATRVAEQQARGESASRSFGVGKLRAFQRERTGQDAGHIERALMPGSNMPRPPACQIHGWPGCQTRTSSFHVIIAARILRPASQMRAGSTARA